MIDQATEARVAAICSDSAYEFKAVDGCQLIWEHHEEGTSLGIYASIDFPGWFLLTFRGSEELRDWLTNFNVWPRADRSSHRGYSRSWDDVIDDVMAQLNRLEIQHLTVTGHSMGGALASLAMNDLPWHAHLVTFGSPKVASRSLATNIEEKVCKAWRYVFGGDLCVLYPFVGMSHIGEEVRIGPRRNFWRMLFRGPWDHDPKNYVQALIAEA